jgi:GAF domain-containing protein
MALAEQCGIAIENARMYEKLYAGARNRLPKPR